MKTIVDPAQAWIPQPAPDLRTHLDAGVRSALQWSERVLEHVVMTLDASVPHERELAGKASGEIAMLLRLVATDAESAERSRCDQLASSLSRHVRTREALLLMATRPSSATSVALGHLCLEQAGDHHAPFDRAARRILRSPQASARERVPFRMLDAAWTRHLAFGDEELDHLAIDVSCLVTGLDLPFASTDDAYSLTHALIYATDFGRVELPARIHRQRLFDQAEALVVKALDENDLDLLAELLIAPVALRLAWTPVFDFGFAILDAVWTDQGVLPGPGLPPAPPNETDRDRMVRVLGTAYHTTLAAGLAYSAIRRAPASLQPRSWSLPGEGAGAGIGLQRDVRLWEAHWPLLDADRRELLDIVPHVARSRRCLRAGMLPELPQLLDSVPVGLRGHDWFVQVEEMVERLELPSR